MAQRNAEGLKESGLLTGTKAPAKAPPVELETLGRQVVFAGPAKAPKGPTSSDGSSELTSLEFSDSEPDSSEDKAMVRESETQEHILGPRKHVYAQEE